MSRNRCDSSCQCGFWSFDGEREVPESAEGLMTYEAYLGKLGVSPSDAWRDNNYRWGYGYRDDLHGYTSWRYLRPGASPNSASWTNGRHVMPAGSTILCTYTTEPVPHDRRYRIRHLQCPLCLSKFAGWYRARPPEVETHADGTVTRQAVTYELYDTSFWRSFNDEPCNEDGPKRRITPDVVREALAAWFAKEAA